MSWTWAFFGLGFTLGPAVGMLIYEMGGFSMPFVSIGSVGLAVALCLAFVIPSEVTLEAGRRYSKKVRKRITFRRLLKV